MFNRGQEPRRLKEDHEFKARLGYKTLPQKKKTAAGFLPMN
jgi:hypothetical protein